jgi:hypothetical protein
MLHRTSVSKGILFSVDNDAGRAIQTAQLSRWYNSNHFAPYGNLYFRFAHTIAKLSPGYNFDHLNDAERDEAIHHFALKLVSLFSATLLCLFLAWLLTKRWEYAIGLTVILIRAMMYDEILVKYIFRAHPDHLLMLATAVAIYYTYLYLSDRSEKNFKLSAVFWGIGFAIKRSLVLFIPSLAYMFLREGFRKETFRKALHFVGWMLVSYLLVGFPQNFGFVKHVNFMLSESHNSQPADWSSVIFHTDLIWGQIKYVLIPILVAHLFWGERKKLFFPGILIFSCLALAILYARKMMSLSEHHTFPYSGMLIVLFLVIVQALPVMNFRFKNAAFAGLLLVSSYFVTGKSEAFAKVFEDQNHCIKESYEFLDLIKTEQKENKVLVRDPYVPFDSSRSEMTKQYWGITFKAIEESKAQLIGTNSNFSSRYLGPPPAFYSAEKKEGWSDKTQFYEKLIDRVELRTPSGKVFLKIYENKCGQSLWKLKE